MMNAVRREASAAGLAVCAWLVWFVWLVRPQLSRPIAGWEVLTWDMALSLQAGIAPSGGFDFPYYAGMIAFCFKSLGVSEAVARLPGVAAIALLPPAVYLLGRELYPDRGRRAAAVWAAVLCGSSPAVIQGALVIDKADTHLFSLAAVVTALFIARSMRPGAGVMTYAAAAAGFAACLALKFSTALALPLAVACAGMFSRRLRDAGSTAVKILLPGAALFACSWIGFCFFSGGDDFAAPMGFYAASAFDSRRAGLSALVSGVALDALRIVFWWSPFLIAVVVSSLKVRSRPAAFAPAFIGSLILVVLAGYLLTNATFAGFPKYVMPALPFLCLIAGGRLNEEIGLASRTPRFRRHALVLVALGVVYYYAIAGDWLLSLQALRVALAEGTMRQAAGTLIIQLFLYSAFAAVAFAGFFIQRGLSRRVRACAAAAVALLASNCALSLIQRRAPYAVNYAYGTRGLDDVRRYACGAQGIVIASSIEGFVANTGASSFRPVPLRAWASDRDFLEYLRSARPDYFLAGWGANTVLHMAMLESAAVSSYLGTEYDRIQLGSYTLHARKRP